MERKRRMGKEKGKKKEGGRKKEGARVISQWYSI